MVEVRLRAVRVDLQSNTPVLLLQETEGEGRTLPIFIGTPEATAIAYALQGVDMPRPMTHDLMKDVLDSLDVEVERVVITELRAATYYAELHLRRQAQRAVVSSRPSDAVAIAVRTGSPLYVADDLEGCQRIGQPLRPERRTAVRNVEVQMRLRGISGVSNEADHLPAPHFVAEFYAQRTRL